MDATTMIRSVSEAASVDEDRARRAIDTVLQVLAQRIGGDEGRQLADQLPMEFQGTLLEAASRSPEGDRFDLDEFVSRVADGVGTERDEAERATTAVLQTVGRAVGPGEWADVLSQLPSSMDSLFGDDRPSDHNG